MSRTQIPAQTIITCDCCGRTDAVVSFVKGAIFHIDQAALDYQGSPVANGGRSWELCDPCASLIEESVDRIIAARRVRS